MFDDLLKYRLPARVAGEEEKSRYRHFATCIRLTVITLIVIVTGNQLFDFHQVLEISVVFLLVFSAIFILFYYRLLTLEKAANLYIFSGTAFVALATYVSGGFVSPIIFWSILIPLYAFWLLNKRFALFWFCISILMPLCFLAMDIYGIKFAGAYNYYEGDNRYYAFVIVLFLILNVFIIGNAFENNKIKSIEEISGVNKDLLNAMAQLEKTKKELETAEKHKDLFIAQMSHEMRTPLNAITGVTELIKNNKASEDHPELLSVMERSARQLVYMIDDILDITKIQTGKFHYHQIVYELRPLLMGAYQSNLRKAEAKKIRFTLSIGDDLPEKLIGDPFRIMQILNNVLENAIKFTAEGEVHFSARLLPEENAICYCIRDSGIGMSEEEIGRVFDIFSQANPLIHLKYGGTGMGLSITRQLVELFGGSIDIKSQPGKGAEVIIVLPCEAAVEQPGDIPEDFSLSEEMKGLLTNIKILIAEDNEVNQLIIRKILHSEAPEIRIDFAADGNEALKKIEAGDYDLALMDIQMPGADGLEAARRIRGHAKEHIRNLKIIALTAFAQESEKKACLEAGMNDYATKPVMKSELFRKIILQVSPGPPFSAT
ncbi:MAG TPA: response regulator [Flavitalea sp.]|nr:response regulator [Flavitalea sp.]